MKFAPLAAALSLAAGIAAADPATGTWQTQPGDTGSFAHVQIDACGAALCGVIVRAYNADRQQIDSDTVGKRMIWDMTANGDGAYSGGKIWAPDRDKVYNSRMALSGDRLKVEGCVFGICRGQTWARVN